jgi:hypothetical protein
MCACGIGKDGFASVHASDGHGQLTASHTATSMCAWKEKPSF